MKKTYKSIFSMVSLFGGLLLTSCLGESENKYHGDGIFTVVKEGSSYTFYADYGGMIRPSIKSAAELSDNGLKDGDRTYMIYQYTDDNIKNEPGKGNYIIEAEFVNGVTIPKRNILMQSEAESKKLLEKDSLFTLATDLNSLTLGAYRGYLTARFNGVYSVVGGKGIYPTLNLVYDPAENERPNSLKLQMCYNRHSASNTMTSSEVFYVTYPLSDMSNLIMGNDSITITIDGAGLTKQRTLKIGREDLRPGNYRYY